MLSALTLAPRFESASVAYGITHTGRGVEPAQAALRVGRPRRREEGDRNEAEHRYTLGNHDVPPWSVIGPSGEEQEWDRGGPCKIAQEPRMLRVELVEA